VATTTTTACTNASVLATWSLPRLAAQTVMVPADEGSVAEVASEVAAGVGGVLLFGSAAPPDLGAALAQLEANAPGGVPPLVATDEEGGAVQRMANLVGSVPSARQMGATMTPAQIEGVGTTLGQNLRAAGVTVDLAPVLDLDAGVGPNASDPDGTRSFGEDEAQSALDGMAFAAGLERGGVVPVVKHFPGLGQASGNTDDGPASTLPWSTLQGQGLVPFETAVDDGVPAVMVANATIPGLSALPASISSAVIHGVLRDRLGFSGVVMTDSLSAGALSDIGYSVPQAAVAALVAGADMVLFSAEASQVAGLSDATIGAIVAAVQGGQLTTESLVNADGRILSLKHVNLCQ
jgi:beta-N-acetylhexosaminidase